MDPLVNLLPYRSPAGQVSYQRFIFSQSWRLEGVGRMGSLEATFSLCPDVAFRLCIPGVSLSKFSPVIRTPVRLGDVVQLLNHV